LYKEIQQSQKKELIVVMSWLKHFPFFKPAGLTVHTLFSHFRLLQLHIWDFKATFLTKRAKGHIGAQTWHLVGKIPVYLLSHSAHWELPN
jgi:hypothetical protein